MSAPNPNNLTWQDGEISREERFRLLGQHGATLWFTGLSGSGKSTIAIAVEKELAAMGRASYRLDGDNIRLGINRNLGFSAADRSENIRRIGEIAKLFADAGMIALTSFISPYRIDRDEARRLHAEAGLTFLEIFVDCPLEAAERRDPKGLYKKARAGQIKNFTGIDDPYEAPETAELVLKSDQLSLQDEVDAVLGLMRGRGVLRL